MKRSALGFTLVELLVVIAIIAILAVVGMAVFTNVQKSARDAKRKEDVQVIAKAYEANYMNQGGYVGVGDTNFASGKIPAPPEGTQGGNNGAYFSVVASDKSGFKVCAALEANPSRVCNTPSINCSCVGSSQGTIASGTPISGDNSSYGLGGSTPSSCDPNGTLLSGLVGYWKMDESTSPYKDISFNNKDLIWNGGVSSITGKFLSAGGFNGSTSYALNNSGGYLPTGGNPRTLTFWFKANTGMTSENIAVGYGCISEGYLCNSIDVGKYVGAFANTSNIGIHLESCYVGGPATPAVTTEWHLYTAVFNGNNTITFYVDGQNPLTVTPGCTINTSLGSGISVGVGRWGYYNGLLDDIRIFNRALAQQEVSALYNSGNGCVP